MPDQINKLAKVSVDSFDAATQRHYDQLVDAVNSLAGHNGTIPLANHINLGGNLIRRLGFLPRPLPGDAVSHEQAQGSYSATALKPQLEASGKSSFSSYRILGNGSQREQLSSYMNDLMSSVPNANGILPTLQVVGGHIQVNIPAEIVTFADGDQVSLQARTDLLNPPASFSISSISAVGNVVTVITSSPTGLVAGDTMTITGVTPPSFNGGYIITSSSGGGTTLTYELNVGTLSGSGGHVEISNVYYYAIKKRNPELFLFGAFNADTQSNRLNANFDGTQIVAVVVLTASGGQVSQTGGGGSPILGSPAAGSFF